MMKFNRQKFRDCQKYKQDMLQWLAEQHLELADNYALEDLIVEVLKYLNAEELERFYDDIWLDKNEAYL